MTTLVAGGAGFIGGNFVVCQAVADELRVVNQEARKTAGEVRLRPVPAVVARTRAGHRMFGNERGYFYYGWNRPHFVAAWIDVASK